MRFRCESLAANFFSGSPIWRYRVDPTNSAFVVQKRLRLSMNRLTCRWIVLNAVFVISNPRYLLTV